MLFVSTDVLTGRKPSFRLVNTFYPLFPPRPWHKAGNSNIGHLVAMLCHCSAGCCGRSGCGMLPGDGPLPVPREGACGGAKARLSQNHCLESRPFFAEGLVCLDSKYCAVKEQMCVRLIGGLREVGIGNSPAPSNFFKRIHMCSAHCALPPDKPAL